MRPLIALALILAAACSAADAPPAKDRIRISGTIVDEKTSQPIERVCISGGRPGDCTWKTDAKGRFRIDGLVPAEWHLYFEHGDYKPSKLELVISEGGETRNVDVRLTPKPERGD